ncbi:MAG: hypothetical protein HKO62_12840, partial [Gammaproteobacteria bacterium]|nr:hypothetical protein [Gammaproteobacteria bacterium]
MTAYQPDATVRRCRTIAAAAACAASLAAGGASALEDPIAAPIAKGAIRIELET